MRLKTGDPIACPDGTWCLWGEGVPTMWGSSQQAVLSAVSLRLGSHTMAVEEMSRGKARWAQVAEQAPAVHRMLCKKLGAHVEAAAPAVVWPEAELWVTPSRTMIDLTLADSFASQRPRILALHEERERIKVAAMPLADDGLSHEEIARRLGTSRHMVTRALGSCGPRIKKSDPDAAKARAERKEARKAEVAHRVLDGQTDREIGKALGVCTGLAADIRREAGFAAPSRVHMSDEETAACVKLREEGLSLHAIAERVGRSMTAVQRKVKDVDKGVATAPKPNAKAERKASAETARTARAEAARLAALGRQKVAQERADRIAARHADAAQRMRDGESDKVIAAALGMTQGAVRALRSKAGLVGPARAPMSEEEIATCVELRGEGWSVRQIAEKIGWSTSPVHAVVKDVKKGADRAERLAQTPKPPRKLRGERDPKSIPDGEVATIRRLYHEDGIPLSVLVRVYHHPQHVLEALLKEAA